MSGNVNSWLKNLGLGQYADAFAANEVDWDLIPDLNHEALKAMGVTLVGHQMRILKAAQAINSHSDADAGEPDVNQSSQVNSTENSNPTPQAERRQLTVMFCDLVASTELSQRLDPEDLRSVIRDYQEACKVAIERYGGFVAKYMGDGVLAYFGYPQAHEDDAERAIRASLDLIEPVSKIHVSDGTVPQIRVGIATGPVVVGDVIGKGVSLESAVVGETPNVAARLQGLAQPNTIIVSPSTYQLTTGQFQFNDLGPQLLKGIEQPVRSWQVCGESKTESRFDARYKRLLTPLTGREEELGILENRWNLTNKGEGQVVLVAGEPGIGKSRLCESLIDESSESPDFVCRFQCTPHHMNSALHPIIHYIEQAISNEGSDTSVCKLDRLEQVLKQSGNWDELETPLIANLLSVPYTDQYPLLALNQQEQKEQTIRALARYIEGLSCERAVVILFEDLHWVDPSTLELLDILIESTRHLPLLMLLTYRPEFNSAWIGQAHVTLVSLNRISKRESLAMLSCITSSKPLSEDIANDIMTKTDGVPLFIEEVTHNVLEATKLDKLESCNQMSFDIPSTLQDSLVARLDRLVTGKHVAQTAAAIGREFSKELIAAICDLNKFDLDRALEELVETGLLFRHGSGPSSRYVFKHALLQDAAYNSLLLANRRSLHQQIATALTSMSPGDFPLLAYHWERGKNFDKAVYYWRSAAAKSNKFYDRSEAMAQYQHALNLIDQQPESPELNSLLIATLVAAVETLIIWRNDGEQATLYRLLDKAIHYAIDSGDLASAALLEGHKGYHNLDEKLLDQALMHAEASGDLNVIAHISDRFSSYLGIYGRYEDSYTHVQQAIKIYEKLGQSVRQATLLIIEGRCYSARAGRIDEAIQFSERAREIAKTHDDMWLNTRLVMECEPYVYKGLWEKAIQIVNRELSISKEIGNWGTVLFVSAWASIACLKLGRLEDAQHFIDAAITCTDQQPNLEFSRAYFQIVVAQLQLARSETNTALETVRQAVELASNGGYLLEHGAAFRALGQVYEAMDDRTAAETAFQESLDILGSIQSRPELAQSLLAYGRFKLDEDAEEGNRLLSDALTLFREMNATGWVDETLIALG